MIFGWRLTNKPPHVESKEVKELHKLLRDEKIIRESQAKEAQSEAKKLKVELIKARTKEEKRLEVSHNNNKEQAIIHLKAAERYDNSMSQSKGSRKSQLKAIVDDRIEKASNLGFNLNGSITETINKLL